MNPPWKQIRPRQCSVYDIGERNLEKADDEGIDEIQKDEIPNLIEECLFSSEFRSFPI